MNNKLNLSAIYAADTNGLIGANNTLPWDIPEDLKYFQRTTYGHVVLMGRKTLESIGRRLPARFTVVLTNDSSYTNSNADSVITSVNSLLKSEYYNREIFVIGGSKVIEELAPMCKAIHVTRVISYDNKGLPLENPVFINESFLKKFECKHVTSVLTSSKGALYSHQLYDKIY